jgi:hypothetical protein
MYATVLHFTAPVICRRFDCTVGTNIERVSVQSEGNSEHVDGWMLGTSD